MPRVASMYSEVPTSWPTHALPLPSVLGSKFTLAGGRAASAEFGKANHLEAQNGAVIWFMRGVVAYMVMDSLTASHMPASRCKTPSR